MKLGKIKSSIFLIVAFATLSRALSGRFVNNIKDCPPLNIRYPPNSVHDLRPDDIKVIGALGDSVLAGYSIRDTNISLSLIETLVANKEYRGLGYVIGGEKGAPTIPNYIKRYQPNLVGYSDGVHAPEFCSLSSCRSEHIPDMDMLNAAQSGAIAFRLDNELKYLIERMKSLKNIDFQNDWKMISIQIGSNDQCQSCLFPNAYGADNYERFVDAAVEKIQANIPKVIVNLIDQFNLGELFDATANSKRCKGPGAVSNKDECPCATEGKAGLDKMKALYAEYNKRLEKIYKKYQAKKSDTFAVIYQQIHVNFLSCPEEYFSNFDCFHASTVGHNFVSKVLWNQLFLAQKDKPKISNFSYKEQLYCPTNSDRIITY